MLEIKLNMAYPEIDAKIERMELIKKLQEQFCDSMQCFDLYEEKDYPLLKQKVAYALFGEPTVGENAIATIYNDTDEMIQNYYSETGQKKKIDLVYNTIIENGSFDRIPKIIYMSIILVVCENEAGKLFQNCVFRIRKCHACQTIHEHANEIIQLVNGPEADNYNIQILNDKRKFCQIFIDDEGRVYENWASYLNENTLPECMMFVPENGVYEREFLTENDWKVKLTSQPSPNSSIIAKATNVADIAGTVGGIGSAVLLCGAAIPSIAIAPAILVGASAVAVGTGIYTGVRGVFGLVDRSSHKQSIGLENSESRGHWMSLAGGVAAGASAGIRVGAQKLIERGIAIGTVGQSIINISTGANIVLNGCSVADSVYKIVTKMQDGENPNYLDILQFTTSVLFFSHAVITAQTARSIISEGQGQVLKEYQSNLSSNNKKRAFTKALKESERLYGVVDGRSQMIRGLRTIENPNDFFGTLHRNNKMFNENNVRFTVSETGTIHLNKQATIASSDLNAMPKALRNNYLSTITPDGRAPTNPNAPPPKTRGLLIQNPTSINFNIDPNVIGIGVRLGTIIINNRENTLDAINDLIDVFESRIRDFMQDILVYVWDNVREIENEIIRIYPNTAPLVVLLRFIITQLVQYVREHSEEDANASRSMILESVRFYNLIQNVDVDFLRNISRRFIYWIREDNVMNMENLMASSKLINCSICSGVYYST